MPVRELGGQGRQLHHNLVGTDKEEQNHKALPELARHSCCKLVQRRLEHHTTEEETRRLVLSEHRMIVRNQENRKVGQR